MSFNASQIVIIPAGCLSNQEIDLQCKAPDEAVFYQFSLANRLDNSDIITSVSAWPSDDTIGVDTISIAGQTFKARIAGGTMNTKSGIRFLVTTRSGEERSFTATITVAPDGIIGQGPAGNYVIGDTGPVGPDGKAATITIGKVTSLPPGSDPIVKNTGTETDAKFDFGLVQGEKGDTGDTGGIGPIGPDGKQGPIGPAGKDGTQILLSNRDPDTKDAKENILWLNDATGDLFESVPAGSAFTWNKTGNIKGEAGSIIYTGAVDPAYNPVYKTGDLYINYSSCELFTCNDKQWVKLVNFKGEAGTRGSLWFFGSEDPVPSDKYYVADSFLNTKTYDLFVFNSTNWQKTGNILGTPGKDGQAGKDGINGKDGQPGQDGKDGTNGSQIINAQNDPNQSPKVDEATYWLNTATYDLFYSEPNSGSWLKIGNLKGAQGDIGPQGKDGQQGKQGDKGDAGARWYSGTTAPDANTGSNDPRGKPRPGDMYLFLDDAKHDVSTYVLTDANGWAGPLGTVTGPQGAPGEQGKQGDTGQTGAPGTAATIEVGTVSTGDPGTSVKITNVGTPSAAKFDFIIPKGAVGETGATGQPGSKGDTGATGPAGKDGTNGKDGATIKMAANDPTGAPAVTVPTYWFNQSSWNVFFADPSSNAWQLLGNTKGPQGDKGDTGQAGLDGSQITHADKDPAAGAPGVKVATYWLNTSSDDLFFADEKSTVWQKIGNLKGDKGDAGTSYTNDGTVGLNVKTIKSDAGNIASDGSGTVTFKGVNINDTDKKELTLGINQYIPDTDGIDFDQAPDTVFTPTQILMGKDLTKKSGDKITSQNYGLIFLNDYKEPRILFNDHSAGFTTEISNGLFHIDALGVVMNLKVGAITFSNGKGASSSLAPDGLSLANFPTTELGTESFPGFVKYDSTVKTPTWWNGTVWDNVANYGFKNDGTVDLNVKTIKSNNGDITFDTSPSDGATINIKHISHIDNATSTVLVDATGIAFQNQGDGTTSSMTSSRIGIGDPAGQSQITLIPTSLSITDGAGHNVVVDVVNGFSGSTFTADTSYNFSNSTVNLSVSSDVLNITATTAQFSGGLTANVIKANTEFDVPASATTDLPTTGTVGALKYNSTVNVPTWWNGTSWDNVTNYTFKNDGTLGLNVKNINSDNGRISSDSSGNLTINQLSADSGKITSDGDGGLTAVGGKFNAIALQSTTFSNLPSSPIAGEVIYCSDAYSTLNPAKTKGILVVWNGTKWVDVLGADIATA